MRAYGILIKGKDIDGNQEREPSEILPVFKYLKEPENYMPILINMILDMIGCYQFPELRHTSQHMIARRELLTNGAFESFFSGYKHGDERRYYALENNYYVFKETCVVCSCDAILGRDKKLHDYCMKVYDAAMFGFQNEDTEQHKRANYEYGMQFVPYLRYFMGKYLMDNDFSRTVRLGACFWKAATTAWDIFPEHDTSMENFMREGKLPEMLPYLQKSPELLCCQGLPQVLSAIYDTLEDYFKYLCPEAVAPHPVAYETVEFTRGKS